jgi:hypothetical protein
VVDGLVELFGLGPCRRTDAPNHVMTIAEAVVRAEVLEAGVIDSLGRRAHIEVTAEKQSAPLGASTRLVRLPTNPPRDRGP